MTKQRSHVVELSVTGAGIAAAPIDLLENDGGFGETEAGAAILLRNERRHPAGGRQSVDELLGIALLGVEPLPIGAGVFPAQAADRFSDFVVGFVWQLRAAGGGRWTTAMSRIYGLLGLGGRTRMRGGGRDMKPGTRKAMDDIKQWVGRTQRASDWITSNRVDLWHATFDRPVGGVNEGDAVPLGFHWSLAQPIVRESDLGPDGHARRGGFLPPIALPRRLWAGSRVAFHRPLRVGERVERVSEIIAVEEKVGRSSALVFVTVRHRFSGEGGLAVEEEQDLVYRETPSRDAESVGGRTEGVSLEASWQRTVHPTETVLFRFSALTMNSHRIHYDRRYATEVEGYDGLVVHGPLIATLLLELAQ